MSREGGKSHEGCPAQTLSDTIKGKGPSETASHQGHL